MARPSLLPRSGQTEFLDKEDDVQEATTVKEFQSSLVEIRELVQTPTISSALYTSGICGKTLLSEKDHFRKSRRKIFCGLMRL